MTHKRKPKQTENPWLMRIFLLVLAISLSIAAIVMSTMGPDAEKARVPFDSITGPKFASGRGLTWGLVIAAGVAAVGFIGSFWPTRGGTRTKASRTSRQSSGGVFGFLRMIETGSEDESGDD